MRLCGKCYDSCWRNSTQCGNSESIAIQAKETQLNTQCGNVESIMIHPEGYVESVAIQTEETQLNTQCGYVESIVNNTEETQLNAAIWKVLRLMLKKLNSIFNAAK